MTVLAADDDPIYQRMLGSILSRWGCEPVIVSNGADALEALQRHDAPELTLIDWVMPRMDDAVVCRRLQDASKYGLYGNSNGQERPRRHSPGPGSGRRRLRDQAVRPEELRSRVRARECLVEMRTRLAERVRELEVANEVIELDPPGDLRIPAEVRLGLYRTTKEALGNVLAHVQAGRTVVRVWIAEEDGALCLAVEDDAQGFDQASAKPGLGSVAMKEFLGAVGGSLKVSSRPGSVATVAARFRLDSGQNVESRVPGSGVRGRGSGERETTASSLAGKQQAREKEDNGGQGKDGPAGAIAQGGNGR